MTVRTNSKGRVAECTFYSAACDICSNKNWCDVKLQDREKVEFT